MLTRLKRHLVGVNCFLNRRFNTEFIKNLENGQRPKTLTHRLPNSVETSFYRIRRNKSIFDVIIHDKETHKSALNLALGLVTSCCSRQTACCWLG